MAILVCALGLGRPSAAVASGDITPASETRRIATALRGAAEAGDVGAAEAVIREIMEILELPTLGPEFGLGAADADVPAIGLFEAEIPIIAKAFVEGRYTALEDLAQAWKASAIGFTSIGGEDFTSAGVERILRKVRLEAEAAPGDWGGFAIRLIDELGDREQYPFSLLGKERQGSQSPSEAEGGSVQAVVATMTRDAAQQLIGDLSHYAQSELGWDAKDLEEQLSSPQNMQQMMQGMLDQNMWGIAAPFLQAAQAQDPSLPSIQEIQSTMAMAAGMMGQATSGQMPGSEQLPPDAMRYAQASQSQLKASMAGDVGEIAKANDERALAAMELRVEEMRKTAVDVKAVAADDYGKGRPDAMRFIDIAAQAAAADAVRDVAEDDLESFEELFENREEERAAEEEQKQQRPAGMVIQLEDDDASKLALDPVQVWLISMDLIDAARPAVAKLGGVRR